MNIGWVLCSGLILAGGLPLSARTLEVAQDGSAEYRLIWEAMQVAEEGDTIYVHPGIYSNDNTVIEKSIVLKGAGADRTKLVGSGIALGILADDVIVEGFSIIGNTDMPWSEIGASIGVSGSATIQHNIIDGQVVAIEISNDARAVIHYNAFQTEVGVRLVDNPNTVDARFNWWGTSDPEEIEQRIWDGNDKEGLGEVLFDPWLESPEQINATSTLVLALSWGRIKEAVTVERSR